MSGPTTMHWPHGVAIADARGPQCTCGVDFPYDNGGWLSFNRHLAEMALAEARLAPGIDWREKCQILRSGLNEVLRLSPDCAGADYARRTLAETSDVG